MQPAEIESRKPAAASLPERIVFYDGVCNFCDRTVKWLLARDRDGRLRFAALQGETAAALRRDVPDFPETIDTIVYVTNSGSEPRIWLRSAAAFEIAAQLAGPARWLAGLRVLPRALTDFFYGLLVKHRYRIFGRADSCHIPEPEARARFLP